MVAAPHMLVGAAGALKVRSPAAGLAVGVLTHLILDAVPHRDYRLGALGGLVLAADLAAGTLSVCWLSGRSERALAGALGGVLPDAISLAERAFGISPTGWVHNTIHTDSRPSPLRSAAIQGLTAVAGALVLQTAAGRESPAAARRWTARLKAWGMGVNPCRVACAFATSTRTRPVSPNGQTRGQPR